MIKDTYGWTLNICINPIDWLMIIVWRGNHQYIWRLRPNPLRIIHNLPDPIQDSDIEYKEQFQRDMHNMMENLEEMMPDDDES